MLSTVHPNSLQRVLILGCGFTGIRVATSLLDAGIAVVATTRHPAKLATLERLGAEIRFFDVENEAHLALLPEIAANCDAAVCSIPTLRLDGSLVEKTPDLVRALRGIPPRYLYLSTTGIYGKQQEINELSKPLPTAAREKLRVDAESSVLAGFRHPLVLRPAAIYGPGRGVHIALREGRYRLTGDGSNYISRIHVDDLAAHVVAALNSDVEGAWPVADEEPCTQREMAEFCANALGLPRPTAADPGSVSETLRANRKVDGSAIRQMLGITLRYPSYRMGVPASIEEERRVSGVGNQ